MPPASLVRGRARNTRIAGEFGHEGREDAPAADSLTAGTAVGRYMVDARVGAGGMGVVYAAHDPELQRKVALKALHLGLVYAERSAEDLLRREAMAMARIAHPNVVGVYDLFASNETMFVAMEFIEGTTFREWLRAASRSWRDVLTVLTLAGRGLSAAHAEGVIHGISSPRTFSSAARGAFACRTSGCRASRQLRLRTPSKAPSAGPRRRPLPPSSAAHRATWGGGGGGGGGGERRSKGREGEEGERARASNSFGVVLYEALFGKLPHLEAFGLTHAVRGGARPGGPTTRIAHALERAMSTDPARRYPSMDTLLDALSMAARPRWKRAVTMAVAPATALLVGLGVVGLRASARHAAPACLSEGSQLGGVWTDATREAMHQAFVGTAASFAEDSWGAVANKLDAYARSWGAAQQDACEATRVRRDQTEEVLALRTSCLNRQRSELAALIGVLRHADTQVVLRSVASVSALPPAAACSDWKVLASRVPLPADASTRSRVESLRARLDEAKALTDASKYTEANAAIRDVQAQAQPLGYAPLDAEILALLGRVQDGFGQYEESAKTLYEAIAAGESAHQDDLVAESWARLANAVGYRLLRVEEGRRAAALAQAAIARTGGDDRAQILLFKALGNLDVIEKRHGDAMAHFEQQYEACIRTGGADNICSANALGAIGNQLESLGRYDEASPSTKRNSRWREASSATSTQTRQRRSRTWASSRAFLGAMQKAGDISRRR